MAGFIQKIGRNSSKEHHLDHSCSRLSFEDCTFNSTHSEALFYLQLWASLLYTSCTDWFLCLHIHSFLHNICMYAISLSPVTHTHTLTHVHTHTHTHTHTHPTHHTHTHTHTPHPTHTHTPHTHTHTHTQEDGRIKCHRYFPLDEQAEGKPDYVQFEQVCVRMRECVWVGVLSSPIGGGGAC